MPDVLPVTVVVPMKLNDVGKIKMFVSGVEMTYQVNGWPEVTMPVQLVFMETPDGMVYDSRFCIRSNLLTNASLIALALQTLKTANRKSYVIFICDSIVNARSMVTDTIQPSGTNGESITGQAISFMSLISSKNTVGNADLRTWAHEVGHGLGLGHVTDDQNFMSPTRHSDGGQLTGFDMLPEQIATMKSVYHNLTTAGF